MEHKLEQLKKLKSITLSNEERGLIRSHAARIIMSEIPSPVPSLFFRGVQHGLRIALSAMFFVVFVGGSVSAIADSALPGDPLYAFKINVNEEVKGSFLKTPEEKVVWQKNRIETRVNEIKTLAASNTLTTAKQAKAKQAIDVHVQELSKELTVLSDEAPDTALTVTASLEQSLKGSRASLEASTAGNVAPMALMRSAKMSSSAEDSTENTDTVPDETGISAALRTVTSALEQVSKEEVKILSKEINSISKEITTVEVTPNASSDTLTNTSSTPTPAE